MGEAAAQNMNLDRTNAHTKQYAISCNEVAKVQGAAGGILSAHPLLKDLVIEAVA